MSRYPFAVISTFVIACASLSAEVSLGEKLETQMWEDMKYHNFTAVESNIAEKFQSVHSFGALTRDEEIKLIKDLYLGSYNISDVKVTENENTLVVTYMIAVQEKIQNVTLSAKPAPRMSVWQKINGKWQWIAHANLKDIPAVKEK